MTRLDFIIYSLFSLTVFQVSIHLFYSHYNTMVILEKNMFIYIYKLYHAIC